MLSEGWTCDRPHPSHIELITGYIQYIYLQQNIILISIVLVFSLLTFCKCSNQFSIFNIYIIMVLLQLYILDISSRGYPCIPDDCSSSTVWGLLSTIFTFHSQAWLPLETLADCDWRARCVCNIARTPHSPHTQTHTRLCCGLLLRRPGCCDDPSTVHRHRASTVHPALVGNYVYCLL